MVDQSALQQFIQKAQGTHTQGQSAVPSVASTGNPNGVYNWSSYSVTPNYQFNLESRDVPASQPGYTPPFAADPYLAGVLAGVPQAQSNPHIDRILGRLFSGGGTGVGGPGAPGWGAQPMPGGTPPGTGPGTGPGAGPGAGPGTGTPVNNPIGPISGPIANNPHNWEWNFNNAQPNTNLNDSGLGRTQALDWLRMNQERLPNGGQGSVNMNNGFVRGLRNIASEIGEDMSNMFDDAIGREGWQGVARFVGTLLGVPGMEMLIPRTYDENWSLSEEDMNAAMQRMGNTRDSIVTNFMNRTGENAMNNTSGFGGPWSNADAQRYYDSRGQMTEAEWRQVQESAAWNNLWYGNDHPSVGSYPPGRSKPTQDNMDAMIRSISANALAWEESMRNRWTRMS